MTTIIQSNRESLREAQPNVTMETQTSNPARLDSLPRDRATPVPSPAARRFDKAHLRRLLLIVAGTAIAIVGIMLLRDWWQVGRFLETTDDAFVGADTTTIAPKVPGFIVKLAVADNQPVAAGDLLALIDDREYRAELARAEATVNEQKAVVANLDAEAALQAALIDQARSKTESTAAENRRAASDGVRASELVKRRVVSEQDFEQADAAVSKARADDAAARFALVAVQRQLAVIETKKNQALATLAQAQAALELAKLNTEYTEIRSPIDGVVGNRQARVGDYATVGARLMSIVPSSGLYVDANFKESQIAHLRPGQPATIEADVLQGVKFHGQVESLAPATGAEFSLLPAENATGNFTKIVQRVPIRIRLDGDAARLGQLRPGLSVTASVDRR